MGKAKKGKKGKDDFEDDERNIDLETTAENLSDDKKRQTKKKDKEIDICGDVMSENEEVQIKAPSKLKKKKKGKTAYLSDEDEDVIDVFAELNKNKTLDLDYNLPNKNKKRAGFAFLDIEGDISNDENLSDDEVKNVEDKLEVKEENTKDKKQKTKKKKKKQEEENLDELLQELALEYEGIKPPSKPDKLDTAATKVIGDVQASDNLSDKQTEIVEGETSKSKKKKKKDKVTEITVDEKKPTSEIYESIKARKEICMEKPIEEIKHDTEEVGDQEEDEGDDDKKKKKKKDKKKSKENKEDKDDKKKKGPGKKVLAAMQEQLKKIQEEEEKKRKELEEKERLAVLAEEMRLEKLRLEKEKKEREKQKKKERIQRLKDEGKYLTAKQKMEKARAEAMLEALRAQGIDLPVPGQKRMPGMDRRRRKQDKHATLKSADGLQTEELLKSEEQAVDKSEESQRKEIKTEEEEIKESWDQDSNDDIKESWDQDSSGEMETDALVAKAVQKTIEITEEKPQEPSDHESSEEEDEEEEDEESSGSESDSEEEKHSEAQLRKMKAAERIKKRKEDNEAKRDPTVLRAPVVCVLGHVDTGKTKILDKLRKTHVQDGEAGGITQQIGATNVPHEAILEQCKMVKEFSQLNLVLPGMLIIDTPGHESFSNLRSRGSSLCDIAILVVDIMHGLEPQTIESINLLKKGKTPFVVALNKIDRLYEWKSNRNKDVRDVLEMQARNTQMEFEERLETVVTQFSEQGLNARVFYDNPDTRKFISIIPTSAITGDGMGNLMALVSQFSQTMLSKRITYSDELQATVLEVKAISGLGTTIDVILINGVLKEGQTVVLAGTEGPIVTQIRSLLMPQPMRELRVKNAYQEYKEISAAQGVKIAAKELEKTIAGLQLLVAHHPDEIDICKAEVSHELRSALQGIRLQERGVYVQASTLGSLEALLEFLKTSSIPYSGIRIGPVVKKDVMRASIMLEHDHTFACILAFDVKVERDAQELADHLGVKIFQADIIYHLFDKFMAYRDDLKQKEREKHKHIAVFPCKLKILPQFIFNSRDPIVMGVSIENGVLREGTPICVPSKDFLEIGIVSTIESNHKSVDMARKGQEICVKIDPIPGESPKMFGRHFDETDILVSKISRESIDACKNFFRDDLSKAEWQLMVELKKIFQII